MSDDCHPQHAQVGWRNCQDPYCITHLTKKMSELSFAKPDNYDETLERRWCESTKDPKENDPQWRRVLDERASEEEGGPVTKWVRVKGEGNTNRNQFAPAQEDLMLKIGTKRPGPNFEKPPNSFSDAAPVNASNSKNDHAPRK